VLKLSPIPVGGIDAESGFVAYGYFWVMNDALFLGVQWLADRVVDDGQARGPSVGGRGGTRDCREHCHARAFHADSPIRFFICGSRGFLLSPVQFPWYCTWLVGFLVLYPMNSVLWMTPLLSLYYLRFFFELHDNVRVFDQ
jgi:hypothetical protein